MSLDQLHRHRQLSMPAARLGLLVYAVLLFFGRRVWVVLRDEPVVHAHQAEDWKRYVARVPRWIGRRPEADG